MQPGVTHPQHTFNPLIFKLYAGDAGPVEWRHPVFEVSLTCY